MASTKTKSSARARIVETAERLFYTEGIRAVGIDRIIAEAKVAKMTLYNHFESKDALILAVLEYREEQFDQFFEKTMEKHSATGADPLGAFFAALKDWFEDPGFRGCSFINASVELADSRHPASVFSAEHKQRFRKMMESILQQMAGRQAKSLVMPISLLIEGAIVTSVMEGVPDVADVAEQTARQLLKDAKQGR